MDSIFSKIKRVRSGSLMKSLAVVVLLSGIPLSAIGQIAATTGTLTGIVTDSTGAVLAAANVTATNDATSLPTNSKTNGDGSFIIPNLAPGYYTVRIEAPGFRTLEKRSVLLDPNGVVRVDGALIVGDKNETLVVTEQSPLLETQQTTLDETISHQFIETLPNLVSGGIRDITTLLQLAPGVVQGANSFQANIAGGRSFQTELLLDGVPMVYSPLASVALSNKPDQDTISEVQVQTGVPTAEWGHSSGGIGSFTTRAGTNQYHGDAVLLLRNTVLDAKPYNSRTKTRDQQFELPMSIGGPIRIPHIYNGKEKSFFFFNYSIYRIHSNATPQVTTVPTALERTGNFSELPANQLIYDPTTGQPFPAISGQAGCSVGRCIPQSRFSATSSAYLQKFIPSPISSLLTNNFIGRTPNSDSENHYFGKIDHRLGTANTLHGSLRWDNIKLVSADNPFGPVLGARYATQGARSLTLGDDFIVRANLVNSFSANYARWVYVSTATPLDLFPQIPGSYGPGFPVVSFTSVYAPGTSIGDPNSFNFTHPFWNLNDSLSWNLGRHSLKFGARYSDYIAQEANGNYANGIYGFSPLETAGGNSGAGDAFASFLLGTVDSVFANVRTPNNFSGQYFAFYGQDSWRLTPTITLNLGLRWDIQRPYNAPGTSIMDKMAPNPGAGNLPGATIFAGPNGTGSRFLPTWFGGIGPRLGVAWNATPNTVVRAGYGILYSPLEYVLSRSTFPGTALTPASPGMAVLQWDAGFQPGQLVPPTASQNPAISNGQSGVTTVDFRRGGSDRMMDTQVVQFDLQHSIKGILLGAAYVGQFAHHIMGSNGADLVQLANINQLPVSDLKYGLLLNSPINSPAVVAAGFKPPYPGFTGTLAQSLRPFPQYGSVVDETPIGNSSFNGLILRAETRFSHGLQFIASYTISKTLTDVGNGDFGLPAPQDQFNRRAERSLAQDDIPRVLSFSYTYQLPIGHGKTFVNGGFAGRVLEGFSISGVQLYQAGSPIAISVPANNLPIFNGVLHLSRGQGPFTTGDRGSIHIGNSLYGTSGTTYLNQAAFALPAPFLIPDPNNPGSTIANPVVTANPYAALGNLSFILPNVRNLGFFMENLSISKTQSFHEHYTFQFGVDFINAFNRTNFGGLNTTFGSPGFGKYGGAASGPRVIQLNSKISF